MRFTLLGIALCLLCITAFLLHRPLKPDEVPPWNLLIMGYTLVMLAAAFFLVTTGGVLALISLSRTREKMRRRLFRFITVVTVSILCLVVLDVIISFFPALEIWNSPAPFVGPLAPYCQFDAELGYRFRPNQKVSGHFDAAKHSDLILTGQVGKPLKTSEPEDGMELVWDVDGHGFCNRTVPEKCDIFVVGDSYTLPPIPSDRSWTALVSKKTGMSLYNAGFPGYSFQQESAALERYGLEQEPPIVLWTYFQGNDLYEAERFDGYLKSGVDYQTFLRREFKIRMPFPYNRPLTRLLASLLGRKSLALNRAPTDLGITYPGPHKVVAGGVEKPIAFNKGYFYSVCLPRETMEESRGWQIGKECLLEARDRCADRGARLVVVYMPAKLTVYLDYVLPHFDRERILEFALPVMRDLSDVDADQFVEMLKENRNVQCEVLKEFCDAHDIEIIDTTPALRASLERGEWPYFCYDTHLNVTGNRVVAEVVSAYLNSTSPSEPTPGGAP